jgi:hypothetical protein
LQFPESDRWGIAWPETSKDEVFKPEAKLDVRKPRPVISHPSKADSAALLAGWLPNVANLKDSVANP